MLPLKLLQSRRRRLKQSQRPRPRSLRKSPSARAARARPKPRPQRPNPPLSRLMRQRQSRPLSQPQSRQLPKVPKASRRAPRPSRWGQKPRTARQRPRISQSAEAGGTSAVRSVRNLDGPAGEIRRGRLFFECLRRGAWHVLFGKKPFSRPQMPRVSQPFLNRIPQEWRAVGRGLLPLCELKCAGAQRFAHLSSPPPGGARKRRWPRATPGPSLADPAPGGYL